MMPIDMSLPSFASPGVASLFLGNNVAAILYGISTLQTYINLQRGKTNSPQLQSSVLLRWMLDTLLLGFIIHILCYSIINGFFSNPSSTVFPTQSLRMSLYLLCLVDIVARSVSAHRVQTITGKRLPFILMIIPPSCLSLAVGYVYGVRVSTLATLSDARELSASVYIALASPIVMDFIISAVMLMLSVNSGAASSGASIRNARWEFAVHSGLITTTFRLLLLIVLRTLVHDLMLLGVYVIISQLAYNLALGSINSSKPKPGEKDLSSGEEVQRERDDFNGKEM